MNICCISHGLSSSDIILIITAAILLLTLIAIQYGNVENARMNRLQSAQNAIIKQMDYHNNLVKGISIHLALAGRGYGEPNMPNIATGQDAFEIFYDILKQKYITMPGNTYKSNDDMDAEERRMQDSFTALYREHGSKFGNYFKNLYSLINYIDDKDIKGFEKDYYIGLIKSQLSKYEILLLAYDCICFKDEKPQGKNFIEFAKKYDLLSALETDELIDSSAVSAVKHIDIFTNRHGITFGNTREFTN